jgi:hypothetical protein
MLTNEQIWQKIQNNALIFLSGLKYNKPANKITSKKFGLIQECLFGILEDRGYWNYKS